MRLHFLNFVLDQDKQTLFHDSIEIGLSKKNYSLLNYLIENNTRLITKDEIMTHVWDGRVVSENTLDQNISTLRKLLSKFSQETIIKTAYAKGFEFLPTVTRRTRDEFRQSNTQTTNWYKKPVFLILSSFIFVLILANFLIDLFNPASAKTSNLTPVVLLNSTQPDNWLNTSSSGLFNLLATLPVNNNVLQASKNSKSDDQQYLNNIWRINPETEAIQSEIEFINQSYQLKLSVIMKHQTVSETLNHIELFKLIQQGHLWLTANSSLEASQTPLAELITADSHMLELYMRGFHELKQGNFEAAINYTELAVEKKPDFYLARIQLAEIKYRQGDNDSSLAELESLSRISTPPELEIPIQSLRGDILDTAGRYEEASDIYQKLINRTEGNKPIQLMDVRYNLSYTLTTMLQYQAALDQLDTIKQQITANTNPDLYAHTLQKQSSIQLQLGQTAQAKQAAGESMRIFNELADDMSAAKVKILLARIANHESDYKQAIHHLSEAIATYRNADFALGVGATLNELIYAQRVSGQLSAAANNLVEMEQIALDIDYFAMLMAAKEAAFEIALVKDQFEIAERISSEYLSISETENFTRGLFKHNLLALDLVIAQHQPELAEPYIKAIEKHIAQSQEQRLEPRLNIQKAQVQLLLKQPQQALKLLQKAKTTAAKDGDQEAINRANNILLEYHFEQQDFNAMTEIVEKAEENNPLPYPFLLYQSKLKHARGKLIEAISLAQLCKQKSNELWRSKDAQYLNDLIELQNQTIP